MSPVPTSLSHPIPSSFNIFIWASCHLAILSVWWLVNLSACQFKSVATVQGARCCATGGHRKVRVFYERKDPPKYTILSRNLVLSQFKRLLKGFHRASNESHPAFVELWTKAILLSQSFQQKVFCFCSTFNESQSCFCRAFNESHPALVELLTKAILLS